VEALSTEFEDRYLNFEKIKKVSMQYGLTTISRKLPALSGVYPVFSRGWKFLRPEELEAPDRDFQLPYKTAAAGLPAYL